MAVSEYLPFATGTGADVETQTTYAGSGHQVNGFGVGVALPEQLNKVWRQASVAAAALSAAVVQTLNVDCLDDGDVPGLTNKILSMIRAVISGGLFRFQLQASSPAMVFNAGLYDCFAVNMVGNVTSGTLSGQKPGQTIEFQITQQSAGGYSFTPPAGVPMDAVDTTVNLTSIQRFSVRSDGSLQPQGGMTVQG